MKCRECSKDVSSRKQHSCSPLTRAANAFDAGHVEHDQVTFIFRSNVLQVSQRGNTLVRSSAELVPAECVLPILGVPVEVPHRGADPAEQGGQLVRGATHLGNLRIGNGVHGSSHLCLHLLHPLLQPPIQQLQHHHRPRRGLLGLPVRFDDVGQTWPPLQGAEQAPGAVQAALLPPPGHPDRHLEHLSMRKDSPPGKAVQLLCREGDSKHQEPVGGVEELVGKGGNL